MGKNQEYLFCLLLFFFFFFFFRGGVITEVGQKVAQWIPPLFPQFWGRGLPLTSTKMFGFGWDVGSTHSNCRGWRLEQCGGTSKIRIPWASEVHVWFNETWARIRSTCFLLGPKLRYSKSGPTKFTLFFGCFFFFRLCLFAGEGQTGSFI